MVLAVAEQLAVALVQLAAGRVVDIDMSVAAAAGPPVVVAVLAAAAVQQVAGVLAGCS